MKISDLLKESQSQIQEGPFTQAIGKVGGKIAKGVAGVGKDLKTGFKAGYSGGQAAAPTAAPATDSPADAAAEPAPKQGILDKVKQAATDFKQGFQQGSGKPAAPAPKEEPAAAAAPAAEPETKPAAEPAAPAQGGQDVAKLKQQIDSLTNDVKGLVTSMSADKRDMLTDIANLKQQVAKLVKPSQAEIDADRARLGVGGSESVSRTGRSVTESIQLFRK